VAKGQMRSNREIRKPKKSAAGKSPATATSSVQMRLGAVILHSPLKLES